MARIPAELYRRLERLEPSAPPNKQKLSIHFLGPGGLIERVVENWGSENQSAREPTRQEYEQARVDVEANLHRVDDIQDDNVRQRIRDKIREVYGI